MIEKEKVEKIIQDFIGVKIERLNNEETDELKIYK